MVWTREDVEVLNIQQHLVCDQLGPDAKRRCLFEKAAIHTKTNAVGRRESIKSWADDPNTTREDLINSIRYMYSEELARPYYSQSIDNVRERVKRLADIKYGYTIDDITRFADAENAAIVDYQHMDAELGALTNAINERDAARDEVAQKIDTIRESIRIVVRIANRLHSPTGSARRISGSMDDLRSIVSLNLAEPSRGSTLRYIDDVENKFATIEQARSQLDLIDSVDNQHSWQGILTNVIANIPDSQLEIHYDEIRNQLNTGASHDEVVNSLQILRQKLEDEHKTAWDDSKTLVEHVHDALKAQKSECESKMSKTKISFMVFMLILIVVCALLITNCFIRRVAKFPNRSMP